MLISLVVRATGSSAATFFDPALRFRALPTEHFIIYFHQGEGRIARRLAAIAEETWQALRTPFGAPPPRRTHVVLVDQWELANGYATPVPYDTVVVSAVWPAGVDFIGQTDDWLRLVFTHEFTHIVHLDRSEGWARAARGILGRSAIAFPNLYLPTWQIEGIATYEESRITGSGRLHAGDFKAIVDEEARSHRLQPLDRVNGGLTDWPGGNAAYAYGLGFHDYLADRFGTASLGRLADATARRVPYLSSSAFRHVFGESLGELWRDFEATARSENDAHDAGGADAGLTRLTHQGFIVGGPRFDRFDRRSQGGALSIVYSARNPDGFPALNRIDMLGSPPRRVATRYLGSTTAVAREALYFDQQEIHRNVGVYSDLYALSRLTGETRRLTNQARLLDPDVSPDGTTLACVQDKPGQRDLVLVGVGPGATVATLISEPETQFNAPRWSPDGQTIAVERHRPGELSQVVLVDVATKRVRALAWNGRARVVTPAWRPDGRAIVVAVAPDEQTFNLYEFDVVGGGAVRQLTRMTGGATWPDVAPDGRSLVFVGYTADGFDVFTMPYPESRPDARIGAAGGALHEDTPLPRQLAGGAAAEAPATPYSPWSTLRPTSWWPVLESDGDQLRVGAALAGNDVMGYHFYGGTATWLTSRPAGVATPPGNSPDWTLTYAYERWQPIAWITAKTSTSFFVSAGAADATTTGTLRERQLETGVLVPFVRARRSQQALVSFLRDVDEYTLPTRIVTRDRDAVRGAWSLRTARTYGYSISPEEGVTIGGTAEAVRRAFGSSADATTLTADLRAYVPMTLPHHVLAARAAVGLSTGDDSVARAFRLGGPGPDSTVIDFSRDAISLLRGFPARRFSGTHVALINLDYRFPIVRPQRGAGTWPLFMHTLHGAAFADAGETWTEAFRFDSVKTSVGAELSADIVAGYFFPFTVSAGAAWGHDNRGSTSDRATFYFRVGRAF